MSANLAPCPVRSELANPFDTAQARRVSSYAGYSGKALVTSAGNDERPAPLLSFIHDSFRALVLSQQFSCVGAKSAVQQGSYRIGQYGEIGSAPTTAGLALDLYHFVQELPSLEGEFSTFVATFTDPIISSESQFETLLWKQLQALHTLDAPHHGWDPQVSNDPTDPHFSFSFAERGFFIVGMHPAASRFTRRFAWPTLVFNVHSQFDALRENGKFERMQQVIRQREQSLQGSINVNLSDFGTLSDARQYSGKPTDAEWRCPFSAGRSDA